MIILKSSSPRRKQILTDLGLIFAISPSKINEIPKKDEFYLEFLQRITYEKLEVEKTSNGILYITSDTIVIFKNEILQKPIDFENAVKILSRLSGQENLVLSSVGLYKDGQFFYDYEETRVQFKEWNLNEIKQYIHSHNVMDKAGAYAIQDKKGPVKNFVGSYSNVVGFPLKKFLQFNDLWKEYLEI